MTNKNNKAQVEHMTVTTQKTQGIVVTPLMLIGAVFALFQFAMGITMWSIQDKIADYDAYEVRIDKNEETLIRLEGVVESVDELTESFKEFAREPRFTQNDGKELASQVVAIADIVRELQDNNTRISIRVENLSDDVDDLEDNVKADSKRIDDIRNNLMEKYQQKQ